MLAGSRLVAPRRLALRRSGGAGLLTRLSKTTATPSGLLARRRRGSRAKASAAPLRQAMQHSKRQQLRRGARQTEAPRSLRARARSEAASPLAQLLFSSTASSGDAALPKYNWVFEDAQGKVLLKTEVEEGKSIMDVAVANPSLDLECACEAELACSTCHVILPQDKFDGLEAPCTDEEDMLDMAFGLTETSRLGCQIVAQRSLDNTVFVVPSGSNNQLDD